MSNIWNYFGMGGKHYWCNKANTMRFYNAVMQGNCLGCGTGSH